MVMAAVWPQMSMLLLILLVAITGTAWFAVLHPDFVWRVFRSRLHAEEMPGRSGLLIRSAAAAFGIAGVMALLFLDWP
jgi:hypothetical protein